MGGSSKTTTQNQTQTNDPWAPQIPYLTDAFSKAKATYDQSGSNPFTQAQLDNFTNQIGFANGSKIPGQTSAYGTGLLSQGGAATSGALSMTPSDIIGQAGQYANNPYLDGQVTAAMRDATRSVNEEALPSIARNAAASGNQFSSRKGIAEGIVQRGLAEKTADVSANLRGNAWSQGLAQAEGARQFNAGTGLDMSKTGLGALSSSLSQQSGLYDMANSAAAGGKNMGWEDLMKYYGLISGNFGGTTTGTGSKTEQNNPGFFDYLGAGLSIFGKAK